jgi:tRNA A-37 threonylcarbamoyl transferase component Bud32
MLKLASALRVGPKMFDLGCEILEYEDCLEVQMELCVQAKPGSFHLPELRRDLRENLLRLHSLQIIHYDIKFENACYSPAHDRYVLIDYGFSRPV